MAFGTPVMEHWLEREITQWVHHGGLIQRTKERVERYRGNIEREKRNRVKMYREDRQEDEERWTEKTNRKGKEVKYE